MLICILWNKNKTKNHIIFFLSREREKKKASEKKRIHACNQEAKDRRRIYTDGEHSFKAATSCVSWAVAEHERPWISLGPKNREAGSTPFPAATLIKDRQKMGGAIKKGPILWTDQK